MYSKKLVAICKFVAKANSALILAALIPQIEIFDGELKQVKSPGFHLVGIPWADDIRMLNTQHSENTENVRAAREAAKSVVNALKESHWEPDVLDNPALAKCFTSLEAMALNLNASEVGKVFDLVGPDPAKVHAAEEFSNVWSQTLSESNLGAAGVIKKPKYEKYKPDFIAQPLPLNSNDIKRMITENTLDTLPVPILKEVIRTIPELANLTTSGRKQELIDKIVYNLTNT